MKFKKHIFICTNDRGEESARKSCGSCGGMDLRKELVKMINCLLYTSPSPRDQRGSRMPASA